MARIPKTAQQRAANTDRWTEILFRALSARVAKRWRFISFRGVGGGEWRGIVDVLAVRKDTAASTHALLKSGDLFEFVLVQMKGGGARDPNASEVIRLRVVARRYKAKAIVLFTWKRGRGCTWRLLNGDGTWRPSNVATVFG